MPREKKRAATKGPKKPRKRRNIGLQCRRKYQSQGGRYEYRRVKIDSGKTKSVHMLSGRSGYTELAYSKSMLLSDDCLVAEIVLEPSRFLELRDDPEDIAETQGELEDDISMASTINENNEKATMSIRTSTRIQTSNDSQSKRCSHLEMQQLKVAITHHFKHVLLLPPIEK